MSQLGQDHLLKLKIIIRMEKKEDLSESLQKRIQ